MHHQALLAKAGPTHHRFILVCALSPLERSLVSGPNCVKHLPGLLFPFYQMPGSSLSVPIPHTHTPATSPLPPATRRTGFLEKFHFFGIHCLDGLTAPMSLLQEHRTQEQVLNKGLESEGSWGAECKAVRRDRTGRQARKTVHYVPEAQQWNNLVTVVGWKPLNYNHLIQKKHWQKLKSELPGDLPSRFPPSLPEPPRKRPGRQPSG